VSTIGFGAGGYAALTALSLSSDASSLSRRVEKHLNDYDRGHPELSSETASDLKRRKYQTSQDLGEFGSPDASRDYQLYSTALNYKQRSRYVANLSSFAKALKLIKVA
jgi:hypothetical protein